ncbi:hypothetical protein [Bacillus sp. OK048]|uniref:hypothetical protein n=1 Tax=Bacillus sp. OK048 TaxID=1882761 RepID=UPI0008849454|nr:hypothetical protein [Bacillus sp. OK048]SDM17699.1 hypothetical protein SAMN05443253_102179 [Bacillus sp. OK048]
MDNKEKMLHILKAYYDKKMFSKKIEFKETDFEYGRHEAAFYLSNLERDGLLEFDGEVIRTGGQRHPKYNNSVSMIWWSNADITRDGEIELKENGLI